MQDVESALADGIGGTARGARHSFPDALACEVEDFVTIAIHQCSAFGAVDQRAAAAVVARNSVATVAIPPNHTAAGERQLQTHRVVHLPVVTPIEATLPRAETRSGNSTPINQRAMSTSCTALLHSSPVPQCQNQCQL